MIIGVLKEIKDNENRVAITPAGVAACVRAGHSVLVQKDAGAGSSISDVLFKESGAEIIADSRELCEKARLVLKIKEPLSREYDLFRPGQMIFTFFHFASSRRLTEAMLRSKATCIAYETVETEDGRLPLLAPMSEVAGKMAPLVAANYLARPTGGKGVLACSVGNVKPARFVVLGGGNAGRAAAAAALGIGADVVIVEKNPEAIHRLINIFPKTVFVLSTPENIGRTLANADAAIGAVHIPGTRTPRLVSRQMLRDMEDGSVIVDVAIDQGGTFETSRPTTHTEPVYREEGVIHYCVANMPGIFPKTSTYALAAVTLPYVLALAAGGVQAFANSALMKGLNIYDGNITNRGVALAHDMTYAAPEKLLGIPLR